MARLLYFSPVTWNSYYQRPHYMVQYFLSCPQNEVLWINPYPTRFPRWQDITQSRPKATSKTPLLERMSIITLSALPIEPIPQSEWINYIGCWRKQWKIIEKFIDHKTIIGVGKPSKLALIAIKKLKYAWSFYDAMDDFPEFYRGWSKQALAKTEMRIAEAVSKVFVSSTALAKKFKRYQTIKITNAYHMASLPMWQEKTNSATAVFGFVGTIGQWFDWKIVIELAKQLPDATIRLIGPCYILPPENLPANIEMLPECTQGEAVKYIQHFDVGLIPFKQNILTQGVDPIKYYEYRALGLPILSTRFGEMIYHADNNVYYIEQDNSLREIALTALQHRASFDEVVGFRLANDWQQRFALCQFPMQEIE